MDIQDTCKTLINSRLFDVMRAQQTHCLEAVEKMGIDPSTIKFDTRISPDNLHSAASLYSYEVKDVEGLAERMLDHPSVELDYFGKNVVNNIGEEAILDGMCISTNINIDTPLPLEYLGVLVGLGRLEIKQSSVHCSI